MTDRERLVSSYFMLGLPYEDILAILATNHDVVISIRTLHRILRSLSCYRRLHASPLPSIVEFIQLLLRQSGALHGYRWLHQRCIQEGFVISRDDVRVLLSILDPTGVAFRAARRLRRREYSAKGPNYIWHFDGYDKVKPYGLCISGCVDGFSRQLIWLNVYKTNNESMIQRL